MQSSSLSKNSTIAAVATAQGAAGVAVIRVSGPKAYQLGLKITKRNALAVNTAHVAHLYDGQDQVLDQAVVIYFKAPHSFTGEDVLELQCHGGHVLPRLVLRRALELGAVQAKAGEFSARAFDSGKLDLVQAEGLMDAIHATSEAAARGAVRSLSGVFSNQINALLDKLIRLRLHVESAIDFPDEEGVDFLSDQALIDQQQTLHQDLVKLLETAQQGKLLRDGIEVVLAGRPNAGKSSLMNRLSGTERAIVTEIAGTTRDTLTETVVLGGLSMQLTDTAGLRDTTDVVESMGVSRAKQAALEADLVLMVHDLSESEDPLELMNELFGTSLNPAQVLFIGNKVDLLDSECQWYEHDGYEGVNVSAKQGTGFDTLTQRIFDRVGFHPPENALIARERHLNALGRVLSEVEEALAQLGVGAGELAAENLRRAQLAMSEITGEFSADDLLGEIFSSFCIGK